MQNIVLISLSYRKYIYIYRKYKIIFPYGQLSVIKHINFIHIYCCVSIVSIGHPSCTWPNKRVCPVYDQKHTVFRVIIKVTENLVISRRTDI